MTVIRDGYDCDLGLPSSTIRCDLCGDERTVHRPSASALQASELKGWRATKGDRHMCGDCAGRIQRLTFWLDDAATKHPELDRDRQSDYALSDLLVWWDIAYREWIA